MFDHHVPYQKFQLIKAENHKGGKSFILPLDLANFRPVYLGWWEPGHNEPSVSTKMLPHGTRFW